MIHLRGQAWTARGWAIEKLFFPKKGFFFRDNYSSFAKKEYMRLKYHPKKERKKRKKKNKKKRKNKIDTGSQYYSNKTWTKPPLYFQQEKISSKINCHCNSFKKKTCRKITSASFVSCKSFQETGPKHTNTMLLFLTFFPAINLTPCTVISRYSIFLIEGGPKFCRRETASWDSEHQ